MPLDGTDLALFGNHPLAKLGAVENLLATEQQWCKGRLRDRQGRHCLVGAMQEVEARQILEPIILQAAREIAGKYYWRIEFFNDDPQTTHADILRVLRLARENIIAEMIDGDQRRTWRKRFAQALRAVRSGSVTEAHTAFRFAAVGTRALAVEPRSILAQSATPAAGLQVHECPSPAREACEA